MISMIWRRIFCKIKMQKTCFTKSIGKFFDFQNSDLTNHCSQFETQIQGIVFLSPKVEKEQDKCVVFMWLKNLCHLKPKKSFFSSQFLFWIYLLQFLNRRSSHLKVIDSVHQKRRPLYKSDPDQLLLYFVSQFVFW